MVFNFKSLEEAYRVARGDDESADLVRYYSAWQHLYDMGASLSEADECYLDKLICDGSVLTRDNYDELGGVPYYPDSPGAVREADLEISASDDDVRFPLV